jgi:hypothetical protein
MATSIKIVLWNLQRLLSVHQLKSLGSNAAWWLTPFRATEKERDKL